MELSIFTLEEVNYEFIFFINFSNLQQHPLY